MVSVRETAEHGDCDSSCYLSQSSRHRVFPAVPTNRDDEMTPRLDASKVSPDAYRAIMGLELYVRHSGLEPSLIELIKLRASYMNGCAYCVDMHSKDARVAGETEQRIYAVPVWRETPFYSD